MANKVYGKKVPSVAGKVRFHFSNGDSKMFDNAIEALQWFDKNIPEKFMTSRDASLNNLIYNSGQLSEVTVTATPKKEENFIDKVANFINDEILLNKDNIRAKLYSAAMDRNPNFSLDWDMASNISEHYNALTGGALNRFSPTLNIRLAYDAWNGKDVFDYEGSWWGNTGLVPEEFAISSPILTMLINGVLDYGAYKGTNQFIKWGNTPKLIGEGAEAEVYSAPFSKYVTKYTSIPPEEMRLRNSVPKFLTTKYIGMDADGNYIYRLPKAYIPENPSKYLDEIISSLSKANYFTYEHPNLLGKALVRGNHVFSDFGNTGYGLIGLYNGKPVIVDMAVESIPDFLSAMEKKGGKLIKKNRK